MRDANSLFFSISQHLTIPGDLLTAAPRIEMIGQNELSIEPHEGLIGYSTNEIRVKSQIGPIVILGSNMKIQLMNQGRIEIVGKIQDVKLPGGAHE